MSSGPSTHQDSPKVPEKAIELAARAAYEDAVSEVEDAWGPEEEPEGVWDAERESMKELFRSKARIAVEAAAPTIFSALLSDEVVEAVVKTRRARHDSCEYEGQFDEARADLQAVIEQVGGGQGER